MAYGPLESHGNVGKTTYEISKMISKTGGCGQKPKNVVAKYSADQGLIHAVTLMITSII